MSSRESIAAQILLEAVEHDPGTRPAFIQEACAGDPVLFNRVEALLRAHGQANPLLDGERLVATLEQPPSEKLGTRIGPYKLRELLGEGGMGSVFVAEQEQPVRRKVALKVIKPGMDSRQVLGRFEAERHTLALMDHPNIAKVLDAGMTDSGRPYFVMELVRGVPITEFCDQRRLDPRKRLELFIQVCRAIQHAHQKGIIHRDIKPSNILVTMHDDLAVPKVIDFGIAKATNQQVTEQSVYTAFNQMIGTPLYMSPEQAEMNALDVDTRSDVYSLGVLLYELLTGSTPFDNDTLRQAAFDEMRRLIRQVDPPRPSLRVSTLGSEAASTVSKSRGVDERHLHRALRGDLDWIVMKALEKDRNRRYATAQELADDLRRYLAGEPIQAKPTTTLQRAAKWSRRHVGVVWSALAGSLLAVAILGVSAALIAKSRDEANEQRLIATEETDKAIDQRNLAVDERNNARLNQYYAEVVSGQTDWEHKNIGGLRAKLVGHLPVLQEPDNRGWEWYYLMSLCHPEMRTLRLEKGYSFAAWSPDGEYIGAPGTIWNSDSGERARIYDTSYILRYRVAWSPDGQKFAWGMASDESAFYVWDRATDTVDRFAGHQSSVWCVAWRPDGSEIATGSIDGTVKIWDVATRSVVRTIPVGMNVMNVAWSPDSKVLVAAVCYKGVQAWDPSTGEVTADVPDSGELASISWHPDGKHLVVATDHRWYLLDRADWSIKIEHPLLRGGQAIACSPDGKQIAVTQGETVTIWDSEGKQAIAELNGHLRKVMSAAWKHDSRHLVTSSEDGEIKLWDLDWQQQPAAISLNSAVELVASLPDNETLVAVSQQEGLSYSWNMIDGSLKKHELTVKKPLCLSPDLRFAASKLDDEEAIAILDTATGATRSILRLRPKHKLRTCAFSPDGSKIAIATVLDTQWFLDCWDVDEERLISSWNIERDTDVEPKLITWASDGSQVAVVGYGDGGDDGTSYWANHLHVIDVHDGKRTLKHRPGRERKSEISCLAWSPAKQSVALGTPDGRVEIVELESRRALFSDKVHRDGIHSLAWHPDGSRLACGTKDGTVKLIAASDGRPLLAFSLPDGSETNVAWSADGKRLAAVTRLGSAQAWNASRGYEFTADGPRRGELAWAYYDRAQFLPGEISTLALRRMLVHAPDTIDYWKVRGSAFAQLGEFDRAVAEFSKTVSPDIRYSFIAAKDRALCLLAAGHLDRYGEACASLVTQFRDSAIPSNRGIVAWLGALTPNLLVNSIEILELAQKHTDPNNVDGSDDDALLTVGACLVRNGQFDEAVRILTDLGVKLDRGGDSTDRYELACSQYFLALARHQLRQDFQARRQLVLANRNSEEFRQLGSSWWREKIALDALRGEAEAALRNKSNGNPEEDGHKPGR